VWEQTPEDAERIRVAVRDLLAEGLSRSEATRIALLNNRALQAAFEEIGIAEAHHVQSGLFTNPNLSVVLEFPSSLGNSGATLLAMISDLWNIPVEEAITERAAEVAVRRVAGQVVATAADAGDAYDAVLSWSARRDIEAELASLQRARLDRVRRRTTGRDDDSDLFEAEGSVTEQDLALASAEKELAMSRASLTELLGLADDQALPALTDRLDVPPEGGVDAAAAVPFALANRFDVAAAALTAEGAAESVEFEHRRVWGDVQGGPAYQGGFGQADSGGGALSLAIPVFDQHQAQIARAEYELRRRQKQLEETRLHARTQVLKALSEVAYRRRQVEALGVRARRAGEIAHRAERRGRGGTTDSTTAVSSRRVELAAQRAHLDAIGKLRGAETELQRALWGAGS